MWVLNYSWGYAAELNNICYYSNENVTDIFELYVVEGGLARNINAIEISDTDCGWHLRAISDNSRAAVGLKFAPFAGFIVLKDSDIGI